jgi:hypothetical protein
VGVVDSTSMARWIEIVRFITLTCVACSRTVFDHIPEECGCEKRSHRFHPTAYLGMRGGKLFRAAGLSSRVGLKPTVGALGKGDKRGLPLASVYERPMS